MAYDSTIRKILDGDKTILSYFSYPAYSSGDTLICENVEEHNDSHYSRGLFKHMLENSEVVNCIDKVIYKATEKLQMGRDNKIAVKVQVDGFEHPLYFVAFDRSRLICTDIDRSRTTEHIIS